MTPGDVVIEEEDGKCTGYALIFLKSKEDVEEAAKKLNKSYIRNRYIEFVQIRLNGD